MNTRLVVLLTFASVVLSGEVLAEAKRASPKKIAMFRLHGPLFEAPRGMTFSLIGEHRGTLRELLVRLDKAVKDKEVRGVALWLDEPVLGWAQMQEIRVAVGRLREIGKDVHCYLASGSAGDYMVAAACNRISMAPSGTLGLVGISAEKMYFKGLLDKLGVVADIQHCGDYKSSGEPYTQTGPSKESIEQTNRLLGDFYAQMVDTIAQSRGLRPEEVRDAIDKGPLTARQAAAAGLVDELCYRHEFVQRVQKRFEGAKLAKRYGRKKAPELDFGSPFGFFKLLKGIMDPTARKGKNVIALVYVDGMIMTGKGGETLFGEVIAGSTTLQSALVKAAEDKTVKAVVLRVGSPGGSALASDVIHQASQVVRKAGKPLIVSMGDIAASGGYYVAAGADMIFAEPGTLTGSIGVVGGKVALSGLFDKIGISTHTYTFGRNAGLFNMTRPFDERERKVVMNLMNESYGQFKRCVVSGRGDRLKGDIDDLAGGRVYTGRQALAKGLVDKLGGMDAAIRHAAARAKVTDYQVRIMPKPKTLFDYITEALGMEDDEDEVSVGVRTDLLQWLQGNPAHAAGLSAARCLVPERFGCVARMLLRLDLLRREPVLMVTPDEWMIR